MTQRKPLNLGYTIQHGAMIFNDAPESMTIEVVRGQQTIIVLTCHGVIRVDGGKIWKPKTFKRTNLQLRPDGGLHMEDLDQ